MPENTLEILYNAVFDTTNKVRSCGREACIELIKCCKEAEPSTDFGNAETGFMQVDNIKTYYDRVMWVE